MNASQIISRIEWVEVSSEYASQPDLREVLRRERVALAAALAGGDRAKIAAAYNEALRVATMWGVDLSR